MLTLSGRTAYISGATGIQGQGIVRALASGGMNIAMVTHNMASAESLIRSLGDNACHCAAYSNTRSDDEILKEVYQRFGSVDVIIPNQGSPYQPKKISDITEDDLLKKFNHQVVGSFAMVKSALPYLMKSKSPRVILMASGGAEAGFVEEGICDNVARGGVISLTFSLAQELAGRNITVNCIAKSGIADDNLHIRDDEYKAEKYIQLFPISRIGTPDEFGAAVAWLASEESGFITGQVINFTGGRVIR